MMKAMKNDVEVEGMRRSHVNISFSSFIHFLRILLYLLAIGRAILIHIYCSDVPVISTGIMF